MKRHTEYLHMRIDPVIKAKLEKLAKKNRRSVSEMVRMLVEQAA